MTNKLLNVIIKLEPRYQVIYEFTQVQSHTQIKDLLTVLKEKFCIPATSCEFVLKLDQKEIPPEVLLENLTSENQNIIELLFASKKFDLTKFKGENIPEKSTSPPPYNKTPEGILGEISPEKNETKPSINKNMAPTDSNKNNLNEIHKTNKPNEIISYYSTFHPFWRSSKKPRNNSNSNTSNNSKESETGGGSRIDFTEERQYREEYVAEKDDWDSADYENEINDREEYEIELYEEYLAETVAESFNYYEEEDYDYDYENDNNDNYEDDY